jgi:hypothetical protein
MHSSLLLVRQLGRNEVFPEEEESQVQYVSSDKDSSDEDEEGRAEQEAYFAGIGVGGRHTSPVREAIASHPEDLTHREEAHFPVLHPGVDQTESTHSTEALDTTD